MLAGTEKFLDNILTVMDNDTSYVLGSVRCLPLQSSVRDTITQTIVQSCNKVKVGTLDYDHYTYNNTILDTEWSTIYIKFYLLSVIGDV